MRSWEEGGLNGPDEKWLRLEELLGGMPRILIAFSGGCDSAFLLKAARTVLGRERVIAVTARSPSLPAAEPAAIAAFVQLHDVKHIWVETRELDRPLYAANPRDRCYHCKSELYDRLLDLADALGCPVVANGANTDDLGDWRPGLKAAKERGVRSPLVEARLSKEEIRFLSRRLGLATWDKPQAACLASRIPYGESVTEAKMQQIDLAETLVKGRGFRQVRVRHMRGTARIEVGAEELARFESETGLFNDLAEGIRALGFAGVELDPEGYRQGKLNRLPEEAEEQLR
jgi:uncharacterized protein